CVRVPCAFDTLREEIAKALSSVAKAHQAGAETPGPAQAVVEARKPAGRSDEQRLQTVGGKPVVDVGPEVLDFVFAAMKVDDDWSVRESRSFTWWGHRLA